MDSIKLLITLNKNEEKSVVNLEITREQSIELRKVLASRDESQISKWFSNIIDISENKHNINFKDVENFEIRI